MYMSHFRSSPESGRNTEFYICQMRLYSSQRQCCQKQFLVVTTFFSSKPAAADKGDYCGSTGAVVTWDAWFNACWACCGWWSCTWACWWFGSSVVSDGIMAYGALPAVPVEIFRTLHILSKSAASLSRLSIRALVVFLSALMRRPAKRLFSRRSCSIVVSCFPN